LFAFFNEGSLIERVNRHQKNFDYYRANEKYRNITHNDYLSWLLTKSGVNIPLHTSSTLAAENIFTAPMHTGMDTCQFYELMAGNTGPTNSFEFCEVINSIRIDPVLSDNEKYMAIGWISQRFDSQSQFNDS